MPKSGPMTQRRTRISKIPRSDSLEIHIAELVLLPGTDHERSYLEISEWDTTAEVRGRAILIPIHLSERFWGTLGNWL
jgi:hypothetical protein